MQAFCLKPVGEIDWHTHQADLSLDCAIDLHTDNNMVVDGRDREKCGLAVTAVHSSAFQ
jgi:hypothetical protein